MFITMSQQELDRVSIVRNVCDKSLRRKDAANLLTLSIRQIQRLVTAYRQFGVSALAHGNRGRPSNNRLPEDVKLQALKIINEKYSDFGPTLANEKLSENHNINVSLETLRKWMIADGIWLPRSQRKARVYQPRYRRDCLGELVQIDGSHHDWFEARSPKCCLLVFIDDATSKIMNLRFSETESAFDYMVATRDYIEMHGKPVAFYSDRHAIFHPSNKNAVESKGLTQYGRVLEDLHIELICANSSQAKGRVERANSTLQDRLIKEMRLQNINTIEEANLWLTSFMVDFNKRFGKVANHPQNKHRKITEFDGNLDDIFCWQEVRKITKSLTVQYDKIVYLIEDSEENIRLVHERVKILDYPDGNIAIQYGDRNLKFKIFDRLVKVDQGQISDNKRLGQVLRFAQEKQDEFEANNQRCRGKQGPKRTAQKRAVEQFKAMNPVLAEPGLFKASSSRK